MSKGTAFFFFFFFLFPLNVFSSDKPCALFDEIFQIKKTTSKWGSFIFRDIFFGQKYLRSHIVAQHLIQAAARVEANLKLREYREVQKKKKETNNK